MANPQEEQLAALMARLLGLGEAVNFTRLEFTDTGKSFIGYDDKGNAYGGDMQDLTLSLDEMKSRLVSDVESGGLGKHFGIYEPVPVDILADMRGRFDDWADIYNAA